jgi:phosphatidylserine/phosphatidylglycerophosphate/cardiolipin synthase-like enzyme
MGLLVLDNQYLGIAQALVNNAKEEIYLSTFKLEINEKPRGRTLKKFFDTLADKAKSGIKVKILFNWRQDQKSVPKTNYYASITLKNAGADTRYLDNDRCCHAKILITDKKNVLLGSHNLSVRSCEANFELSYLIPDPETVAQAHAIFENIFSTAKKI